MSSLETAIISIRDLIHNLSFYYSKSQRPLREKIHTQLAEIITVRYYDLTRYIQDTNMKIIQEYKQKQEII